MFQLTLISRPIVLLLLRRRTIIVMRVVRLLEVMGALEMSLDDDVVVKLHDIFVLYYFTK